MSGLVRGYARRGEGQTGAALYRSILGANAKIILHQARGLTFGTGSEVRIWTDVVTGNAQSVSAASVPQRPLYVADGSRFGGKPVLQCNVAANRYFVNAALNASLFPAGCFPYVICRMAIDATVNNKQVVGFSNAFNSANKIGPFTVTGNTYSLWALSATRVTGAAYSTTQAQTVEWTCDGSNALMVVNGVTTSAAFASTYATNAVQRLTIGGDDQGVASGADASFACVIICLAKPTASQLTRIRTALAREFPA